MLNASNLSQRMDTLSGIRHRRATLSYLLSFSVIRFTRYSLFPWLLVHLHSRKFDSWGQVVVVYCLTLTVLQAGVVAGQLLSSSTALRPSGHDSSEIYRIQRHHNALIRNRNTLLLSNSFTVVASMTLMASYIGLAFVSRFSIMLVLVSVSFPAVPD